MAETKDLKDQIRRLDNMVVLQGKLCELTYKLKTNPDSIYMRGVLQCGENASYSVGFSGWIKSKRSNGEDSKAYPKVLAWVKSAVTMTKDPEKASMVKMIGSLVDNANVNREGKLVEGINYRINSVDAFENYCASIDIEGYIVSITDEMDKEDNETGRKRMRILSRDIFNNTLDIKNIIIPADFVESFEENGFEAGKTAKFFIDLIPHKRVAATKGIGTVRSEGKAFIERVVVGANLPYEEDSKMALSSKVMKAALNERKAHLAEIEEAGYQGGNSNSSSNSARGTVKAAAKATKATEEKESSFEEVEDFDDDDLPF